MAGVARCVSALTVVLAILVEAVGGVRPWGEDGGQPASDADADGQTTTPGGGVSAHHHGMKWGAGAGSFRRGLCGLKNVFDESSWVVPCEAFSGVGARRNEGDVVVMHDIVVGLPIVLFVLFLASQARASGRKLRRGKNGVMTTTYVFLWVVCVLNVLRCGVQMWQAAPAHHETLWNALWLATRFGLTFLEVSVVVFLAQGYRADLNHAAALGRTVAAASCFSCLDLAVKAVIIFGAGVQLFVDEREARSPGYYWIKWGYWAARGALFAAVYAAVLVAKHITALRDMLPAQPSFYRYAGLLLAYYSAGTVAALGAAGGARWGYCLAGICNLTYYTAYPPLLYVTFLADFFREDEDEFDAYYGEIEEAGYFAEDVGNSDY